MGSLVSNLCTQAHDSRGPYDYQNEPLDATETTEKPKHLGEPQSMPLKLKRVHESSDNLVKAVQANEAIKAKNLPKSRSNMDLGALQKEAKRQMRKMTEKDFVFHNILGVGGFGKVYLATKVENPEEAFAVKVISKSHFTQKSVEQVLTELKVLSLVSDRSCPFLTKMFCSFQSDHNVYFCLEFLPGGNLRNNLDKMKTFSKEITVFVAAEILCGLQYLHEKLAIIHRDLKLENILVDHKGHCKLTDFGLSKIGNIQAYSFCGTYNYIAPELIKQTGYNHMIDYWMLGCLIFEMLTGRPPFDHKNRKTLFDAINAGCYKLSMVQDADARDLISKLLVLNPEKRLGQEGAESVKRHQFFSSVDWDKLSQRKYESPLKSELSLNAANNDIVNDPSCDETSGPCGKVLKGFSWVHTPREQHASSSSEEYQF